MNDIQFDCYGSTLRLPSAEVEADYLDLRQFDIRFFPATHPAGIFFYEKDGDFISSPYVCRSTRVPGGIEGVRDFLSQPGVHCLMYVQRRFNDRLLYVRSKHFAPGTPEADYYVGIPLSMSGWLSKWHGTPDLSRFPHSCPSCSSPAYIGFSVIECSRQDCRQGE